MFVFPRLCQLMICLFLSLSLYTSACVLVLWTWLLLNIFFNPWWYIWLQFSSTRSRYIFWWVFFISYFSPYFLFSHVIIAEGILLLFYYYYDSFWNKAIFFRIANFRNAGRGRPRSLFRWVRLLFMTQRCRSVTALIPHCSLTKIGTGGLWTLLSFSCILLYIRLSPGLQVFHFLLGY